MTLAIAFSHPDISVAVQPVPGPPGDRRVHFRHGPHIVGFPTVTTTVPAAPPTYDTRPARRTPPPARRKAPR